MIQNHSFKYQLIRDILPVMATIVIFVWIIFSYKLYKQIFLINILGAVVWKLWSVWFNFGCFQHISALKLIKYLRDPLKESKTLHSVIYYTARHLCSNSMFALEPKICAIWGPPVLAFLLILHGRPNSEWVPVWRSVLKLRLLSSKWKWKVMWICNIKFKLG